MTSVSMNISAQLDHKYVLAVEGVDKASSTQWIMMSGSVLVMPPPSQESWLLEGRFAPWVHYVSRVLTPVLLTRSLFHELFYLRTHSLTHSLTHSKQTDCMHQPTK